MFRVVMGVVFFLVSSGLLAASVLSGFNDSLREILGNLGTEVFGILVTIALVDLVLEKRRRQDRGRELAWSVMHAIEHAVWVWQGGPRQMGTNELLGIVTGIDEKSAPEPFSEGLIMNIGLQCRSILQRELSPVKSLPGLRDTFRDLVSLATLKDLPSATRVRTLGEILESSVAGLARVLRQPAERMPTALIWYRDASPTAQRERYRQLWPGAFSPFDPQALGRLGDEAPGSTPSSSASTGWEGT